NQSVAMGIHAMPARTEKKRNSGVRNDETAGLTPIAIPRGTAVITPMSVPNPTRNKLAPMWPISEPSRIVPTAASATEATDGNILGLTSNNGITIAQIATNAASGATNMAAPASAFNVRQSRLDAGVFDPVP